MTKGTVYLCESPTTKALNEDVFGTPGKGFIATNLGKNHKYTYLPNAYFDGATLANKYTPNTNPYSVTLEDYVYDGQYSSDYNTMIYTVIIRFDGDDSERLLKMYQDPYDKQWYIFSDTWKGFLSDIKVPEE